MIIKNDEAVQKRVDIAHLRLISSDSPALQVCSLAGIWKLGFQEGSHHSMIRVPNCLEKQYGSF